MLVDQTLAVGLIGDDNVFLAAMRSLGRAVMAQRALNRRRSERLSYV